VIVDLTSESTERTATQQMRCKVDGSPRHPQTHLSGEKKNIGSIYLHISQL
jgi:hypothetical protein